MGPEGKGCETAGWITCLSAVPGRALGTQCLAAGQKLPGHQSSGCSASQTYRHLRSRHTPTTIFKDLLRGRRCPTSCQPCVHTATELSTSWILLLHCQPVLRCDQDRRPRSPHAQQPDPAQRENLPSSTPSPHMEKTAPGAAQGGLPLKARPAVASSRLTGITLGDLLIKDQRHPG